MCAGLSLPLLLGHLAKKDVLCKPQICDCAVQQPELLYEPFVVQVFEGFVKQPLVQHEVGQGSVDLRLAGLGEFLEQAL